MRKRERQDDALSDDRVKQIVESNDAAAAYAVFSRLSLTERRLFIERAFATDIVFKPFYGIPQDLIRIIATMTPGTLMKLALTMNRFFIELSRDDNVWQRLYRRDFPHDYAFCRGVLPFFVLEPTHPFYMPGSVSEFDPSPWKRYYLHTAYNYYNMCDYVRGCLEYADEKDDLVWLVDPAGSTSRQVYDWCHEYAMSRNYESFDRRASLAWIFVCLFAWYVSPEGTVLGSNRAIAKVYARFARSRPWMYRYLLHMRPDIQNRRKDKDMYGELSNRPLFGPLLASNDLQRIAKQYPIQRDWENLFSNSDKGHLKSFIDTCRMSPDLNPAFQGVFDEQRANRNQIVIRCWDLLVDCYRIPCVTSLHLVDVFSFNGFADVSMTRNSEEIRQKIQTLISNANGRLIMDLDMKKWSRPIFNSPEFNTEARTIMDPWFLISQSNIFHQHTMIYQLKTNDEKEIFEENSTAPRMAQQDRKPILYIEQPICLQCGTVPAIPQQCGGTCQQAIYCGVECQRVHWVSEHHNECKKKI
jgi:hypothetical protein